MRFMLFFVGLVVVSMIATAQNVIGTPEANNPVLQVKHGSKEDFLTWKGIELRNVNSLEIQKSTDGKNYSTLAIVFKEIASFSQKPSAKNVTYRIRVLFNDYSYIYIKESE